MSTYGISGETRDQLIDLLEAIANRDPNALDEDAEVIATNVLPHLKGAPEQPARRANVGGPFVSIWTGDDTSEAGPTVDEKGATVVVEPGDDTILVHITTDDASIGLWSVALTLSRKHAGNFADDIQSALDGRL